MCAGYDEDVKNITNLFLNGNMLRGIPYGRDYYTPETRRLYKDYIMQSDKLLSLFIEMISYAYTKNIFILCRERELEKDWMWMFQETFYTITGYRIMRYPHADEESYPNYEILDDLRIKLFFLEFHTIYVREKFEKALNRMIPTTLSQLCDILELPCDRYDDEAIKEELIELWRYNHQYD